MSVNPSPADVTASIVLASVSTGSSINDALLHSDIDSDLTGDITLHPVRDFHQPSPGALQQTDDTVDVLVVGQWQFDLVRAFAGRLVAIALVGGFRRLRRSAALCGARLGLA